MINASELSMWNKMAREENNSYLNDVCDSVTSPFYIYYFLKTFCDTHNLDLHLEL